MFIDSFSENEKHVEELNATMIALNSFFYLVIIRTVRVYAPTQVGIVFFRLSWK